MSGGTVEIAFVMDPLEGIVLDEDTTFAFMLAARARDYEISYVPPETLAAEGDRAFAQCHPCEVRREEGDHFDLEDAQYRPLSTFDCVFMRKDPPFDVDYLHACHLLELARRSGTTVVNDPTGLRTANEKLYALHFAEFLPDTVVTRDRERIRAFMSDRGGRCVLKPVDGYAGESVFVVDQSDRNHRSLIDTMTDEGRQRTVCQAYEPDARVGDKRILLLDGAPMGGILRVPPDDDHRGNIHVGGSVEPLELTDRDREICRVVGERLRRDGLWFAGIDVLGDSLTEINVTSPTGIQEMSRFDEVDGAGRVVESAVARSRE